MANGPGVVAAPSALATSVEVVFARLRQMAAAGTAGFEGLVADTLSEVSGQTFRLMKPGPQGGADALSEPVGNGLVVVMEGKRFQEGTRLPLDELKAKIADTAQTYPAAELWVLAASRDVAANDVAELKRYAEPFGMAVLVLDTRALPGGLPLLAVLCAAAPRAMAKHFPAKAELATALDAVRSAPGYEDAAAWLRERLHSPDVGYAATRTALARWMRTAMADLGTAKANLGSHADVLSPVTRARVRRVSAEHHLDRVITGGATAAALLGGEGTGKTWAVLSWWDARAGSAGDEVPLTVWLPAGIVGEDATEDLIARALHDRTGTRDRVFWLRRLRRWRAAEGLRLLVIVDGLNQNWIFERWTDLLQPLLSGEWRGKVSVVLTCRPDHWAQLSQLRDLVPPPVDWTLQPFDDAELDAMLAQHHRGRADYEPRLLELMCVPRLFSLVVARAAALDGMTDLTPEALVLKDWRDRVRLHGNKISLGHEEFRDLVSRLGSRFREALAAQASHDVTRAELLRELGRESGYGRAELTGAVSELVDGRWLPPVAPHRFRLDRDLAPIALGLSLLDVLKAKPDPAAIADAIADFTDPLRGADLGVTLLRAATTAALLESETPPAVARALLLRWLASQNFRELDFQSFWRLLGIQPELFLDVAQEEWLARRLGSFQDEVLAKAFANASKWDAAARAVDDRVQFWMSAVWSVGMEFTGPGGEGDATATRTAAALRSGIRERQQAYGRNLPGLSLLHVEDDGDGWRWLLRRAVIVCSYRPRAPVSGAFAAWALTGAIMGTWPHRDPVAWTLRLNLEDPVETERAVLADVEDLAASGWDTARHAAEGLVTALASTRAADLAARAGLHSLEPRLDPSWTDPHAPAPGGLTAGDAIRLGREATSSGLELAPEQVSALVGLCRTAPVAELLNGVESGVEVGVIAALARWAPAEIRSFLRRAAEEATEARELPRWLEPLLAQAAVSAMFTDGPTRAALAGAWDRWKGEVADRSMRRLEGDTVSRPKRRSRSWRRASRSG